jgi:enterochelin esterase-like enzyme
VRRNRHPALDRLCALLLCLAPALALAQTATPGPHRRFPAPHSPAILPDSRVTFSFPDPNAQQVDLSLDGYVHKLPMQKNSDGLWTLTVGPLEPQIYSYHFVADGVSLLDPSNPDIIRNLLSPTNEFEVPGKTPAMWDDQDVPHGVVHHHFYQSSVVGDARDFFVYTPPGYDPRSRKKYPVLYLLHGFSDDASAWTSVGRANFIFDNLLAQHTMQPMVVVMPLGYGAPSIVATHGRGFQDPQLREKNFSRFTQALLTEVIPRVQADYRVSTKRQDRAIAGLSMGGAESLLTGLNHIDTFAWVGAFSAGGLSQNFAADFPNLNATTAANLRLLWVACGENDRYVGTTPLITVNRNLVAWMKGKNIPVTFVETPGMHQWRVWRGNLVQFAPLLFRPR